MLTIEFAFNNFVKCLFLFECFESHNSKSLLKMCVVKINKTASTSFWAKYSLPTKSLSNSLGRIEVLLFLGFQKVDQPLPSSKFSKMLETQYHSTSLTNTLIINTSDIQ